LLKEENAEVNSARSQKGKSEKEAEKRGLENGERRGGTRTGSKGERGGHYGAAIGGKDGDLPRTGQNGVVSRDSYRRGLPSW